MHSIHIYSRYTASSVWCLKLRFHPFFCSRLECEHFSLPAPDLSLLESVAADIAEQEQTWTLYEEFSSTLDGLSGEDWISFR